MRRQFQRVLFAQALVSDRVFPDSCQRVAFIDQGKIVALDTPHALKQQYGKRMIHAQVAAADGGLHTREIILDRDETPGQIEALFRGEQVVTIHSEEATLEDIFIRVTGRGLS